MKVVVFSDLHIYHPFSHTFVRSKDVYYWYYQGIERYVKEIVHKERPDYAIFLGDVHHSNFTAADKYQYFKRLVDMLRLDFGCDTVVVLGNHDTSGSYSLDKARVITYVPSAFYITVPQQHTLGGLKFIFLPFCRTDRIIPALSAFATSESVYILSHNNIYLSDMFYNTHMIKYSNIRCIFPNGVLINGHIHRFYAESGYYQLGSVNPTSYKEYLNAVGSCVVSVEGVRLHKNTHLFLVSALNRDYTHKVDSFLSQAELHDSIVFLRTTPELASLFRKYQCVKVLDIIE